MSARTYRASALIPSEWMIEAWSAYPLTLSGACEPGGDAQCDGHDYDRNETCECPCHDVSDLPSTTAEVKTWHDEMHAGRLEVFGEES